MKHFPLFLLYLAIITGASADVHTSSTYYTYGATVHDSVTLNDNAQFANMVGIGYSSIVGMSGGWPVMDEEDSSFATSIIIDSKDISVGGKTSVQADDAYWSKNFEAGKTNSFTLDYCLGTGNADAEGHRTGSTFVDGLVLDQTYYSGTITGSDEKIALSGKGIRASTEDTDSRFEHTLTIGHGGKWGKIDGDAYCVKDGTHDVTPTIYAWTVDVSGGKDVATSEMEVVAVAGDRHLDATLTGTCSVPGLLPEGGARDEIHIEPLDDTIGKEDPSISDLINLLNSGITNKMWGGFDIS